MTESAATNGVDSRIGAELDDATVAEFKDNLHGEVLVPDDLAYDSARMIWNRLIDKRPALIARCATADDVVRSVRFAREHDLAVAVRGGGHNIAGNCVCDGGLMIDLSPMKGIQVDPQRRTARAQPGLTLGEFDRHTQAHGLATTMGIASEVGIAGLTLGGGYGWLAGRYGLACDNLLSVALVTAEGKHVSASEGENAELFWGVRGGGANFGVITSFEYRLNTVGKVLGGMVLYAPTRDALRFFDEFSSSCPDEVSTMGLLTTAPDGNLAFAIVACHCGPIDEGEKALAPLRNFGPPLADMLEPRDYTDMQSMTDEAWPPGRLYHWKSGLVRTLGDEAIDVFLEYAARKPTALSVIGMQQLHGAAARMDAARTAFPHRFDHYNCTAMLETEDHAAVESGTAWSRKCYEAMRPFAERATYVNDLGEERERLQEAYGPSLERLRALKTEYDPTDFFRLNQLIKATAA
jgi:FAD/FMN-containing dehydrogenase